ncbi:MAG: hypothetical protein INR62_07110 [Rhodospirillales bacterium]|nr:hypothetical protein [Acetobacter sp.]
MRSAPDGTVPIFGLSDPVERTIIDAFQPTNEAAECKIVTAPVDALAFPLHAEAVSAYFRQAGNYAPQLMSSRRDD